MFRIISYMFGVRHARLENLGKRRKNHLSQLHRHKTLLYICRHYQSVRTINGGYEFYSGKKKLFRIDNNLPEGSTLAIKLQVKQVPCDKAGMTIDKFT